MKYQAAIFDIDGTLLDTVDQHAEAWRIVFERQGKNISFQDVRAQIGKGGDQLLPVFFSPEEIDPSALLPLSAASSSAAGTSGREHPSFS